MEIGSGAFNRDVQTSGALWRQCDAAQIQGGTRLRTLAILSWYNLFMGISSTLLFTSAGLGLSALAIAGAVVAWVHNDRLEGKEDIIRSKDETIRAKEAEIESLRRQIQSPSDLLTEVELIKARSEAEVKDLRRQLSTISESESARRAELEAKIKTEQDDRGQIMELQKKLADQLASRAKLEQEVVALKAQTNILARRSALAPGLAGLAELTKLVQATTSPLARAISTAEQAKLTQGNNNLKAEPHSAFALHMQERRQP